MYKILIMLHGMPTGGTEIALLSMFDSLDYGKCEIELLLVKRYGSLLQRVPKEVKISNLDEQEALFWGSMRDCLTLQCMQKNVKHCIYRILMTFKLYFCKCINKEFDIWEKQNSFIQDREGEYDIAIDYDGFCNRYIATKVKAGKKISWNHFDYRFFKKNVVLDCKYFSQMDYLIAVSKKSTEILKEYFPELKEKIKTIYNFIDKTKILELSKCIIEEKNITDCTDLKICSVGRLESQKGYELSIKAAAYLKNRGIPFIWYILGEGKKKKTLEALVKRYFLENQILLLGNRDNPYPYMANADIYVQTSEFEGYGIALAEARLLNKPAIVTNVTGLNEQVKHGIDGIISERNAQMIANGIELLSLKDVREKYIKNLKENTEKDRENKNNLCSLLGFECFRKED